jgi:murein DD-endopeptidase MepM/ murein hydrolase activator NlpD
MLASMPGRACVVVALLLVACRSDPSPATATDATATDATTTEPRAADADSEGPDSPTAAANRPTKPDDPFLGVEAMRPRPWAAWPLENLDILSYDGWRIDPTHGGFVLERGLIFATEPGVFVLAIADAEVLEVRRGPDDQLELRLDHGDGIESHYAPMSDALVHAGLTIDRSAAIGLAAGKSLRLRVTVDGLDIDPLLVLRQPLHRWPALGQ